jgi:hypothetical protein
MSTYTLFIDRFKAVFAYISESEAADLAVSAEENSWTIEQCLNDHVLGHAVAMACDLGVLEGSPDEEILELIQARTDYYPPEAAADIPPLVD